MIVVVNVRVIPGPNLCIHCSPNPVPVPQNEERTTLSFQLSPDACTSQWQFESEEKGGRHEDSYFGITIYRDGGAGEFSKPHRYSDGRVDIIDLNNNCTEYKYRIRLINKITGQHLDHDPSIENQTVHGKEAALRVS